MSPLEGRRRSLVTALAVWALVLVAGTAGGLWVIKRWSEDRLERVQLERVRTLLQDLWARVEQDWEQQASQGLARVFREPGAFEVLTGGDADAVTALLGTRYNLESVAHGYRDWQVVDAAGRLVVSLEHPTAAPSGAPVTVRGRPVTDFRAMSTVWDDDGFPILVTPAYGHDGRIGGWSVVRADGEHLVRRLGLLLDDPVLVRDRRARGYALGIGEEVRLDRIDLQSDEIQSDAARGRYWQVCSFPTEGGLAVSVFSDVTSSFVASRTARRTAAAAVVGLLAPFVFVGLLYVRRRLRPLRELSELMRSVERDGRYGVQASVELADEVGVLAASFNRMSARIAKQFAHLEEARGAAKAASREKSAFLANMSHEIRTPMGGVLGMASLLRETELTSEQRDWVEMICTSGESLLTILNDVLDFSKIESGKIVLEDVEVRPSALVHEVVTLLASRAQEKGLEISCDVADDVPAVVRGDGGRLRQVLLNLVGNAVKFTSEGEVALTVSTDAAGGEARLRFDVEDTGIGMPAATIDKLFTPFTQADESTTRRFGGTGLGLTISRRLVELMGGDITVRSIEGEGSTFSASLPCRTPIGGARPDRRTLRAVRVLVLVAHPRVRAQCVCWLERAGASVRTARSLEDAHHRTRRAARAHDPVQVLVVDAALVPPASRTADVTMQGELGPRAPKVVLLTTHRDRTAWSEFTDATATKILPRPVGPGQLAPAVRRLLDQGLSRERSRVEARAPASSPAPGGAGDEGRPRLEGRVLVAEDNAVNQTIAVRFLERLGLEVDVVDDGAEALEATAARDYDAVLMDCQMPVMDGYAATRAIREREAAAADGRRLTVIALTANAIEGDRERCDESGMDDYLTKPVEVTRLAEVLGRWIAGRQGAGA